MKIKNPDKHQGLSGGERVFIGVSVGVYNLGQKSQRLALAQIKIGGGAKAILRKIVLVKNANRVEACGAGGFGSADTLRVQSGASIL